MHCPDSEPLLKTSDFYRTCTLPKRFEYPCWFHGYGIHRQPQSHPFYKTTSSDYGRCKIEECDDTEVIYETDWLENAVPYEDGHPSNCLRYTAKSNNKTGSACLVEYFDRDTLVTCHDFVYETDDITIGRDFNITCEENLWQLTLIGTLSVVGEMVCLPLSGYFSDKYGRKTLMIFGSVFTALVGIVRSFMPSHISYTIMVFLGSAIGSGIYSAAFILAMELLAPAHRVIGNTILASAFAFGEVLLGLAAWVAPSWNILLLIIFPPGILFISYIWLTNESIRWLLSKGYNDRAKVILQKVAKMNGTALSDNVVFKLDVTKDEDVKNENLVQIFRAPKLVLRLINCSVSWICCTFVYYGLTLHSVSLSGNEYLNFISVALIEIFAYIFCHLLLNRVGRRFALAVPYILSGFACLAYIFVPEDQTAYQLALYLLGKFFATIAFTVLYIYTAEMFPTSLRHSLLATCSMFGRLGSMVAPQIPLLVKVWKFLPLMLFGIMAFCSGVLSLFFPETKKVKLPDTIEEALTLSK